MVLHKFARADAGRPSRLKIDDRGFIIFCSIAYYRFFIVHDNFSTNSGEHTCMLSLLSALSNIQTQNSYPLPFLSMYVKPGQHTCMLSAFMGEHTYTPTNLGPSLHTENSYLHLNTRCLPWPGDSQKR